MIRWKSDGNAVVGRKSECTGASCNLNLVENAVEKRYFGHLIRAGEGMMHVLLCSGIETEYEEDQTL